VGGSAGEPAGFRPAGFRPDGEKSMTRPVL
jgi:hypothetical protein